MGKLADWCAQQSPWVRDALGRAAACHTINEVDAQAVADRVALAHGISMVGDYPCSTFDEACLSPGGGPANTVLLSSIGPLGNVDRLASDQELKFALNGITLIFGENASGKSGYARAVRRLCKARFTEPLQGDIYSPADPQPATVRYSCKVGTSDPVPATWTEGDATPADLAGMTFLDTSNAHVYVEGETEILFLPAEVQCLTHLGQLYAAASAKCQANANVLTQRFSAPFGGQYDPATVAGKLVARLVVATSSPNLPSEEDLRAAASWTSADDQIMAELRSQLGQSAHVQATRLGRIAGAADLIRTKAATSVTELSEEAMARDLALVGAAKDATRAAQALAAAQVGGQPIQATGSDTWRQLFIYARQFIAEAGIVPEDGAFASGDPCPLCQRPLDLESSDRLNAFDAYIEGEATRAVAAARRALTARVTALRVLSPGDPAEARQQLAELGAIGASETALVDDVIAMLGGLATRKTHAIAVLEERETSVPAPLDCSALDRLGEYAKGLVARAEEMERTGSADATAVARERELRDRKTLSEQIDEMIDRRNGLADRHRYLQCVEALNTRPVSVLASSLRGELVTPELKRRLVSELDQLGLAHVPLRFREASHNGKSFFEMALDTTRRSDKAAILSEGEQRALAIACFLADSHVATSKGAIIVDDPVTSLDHQRLRKVARRFVQEAAKGRQIIIFTHNLLFYQEVMRACAEHDPPVAALPCLVQQALDGFGLVTIDDQPWIAKKVKDRERVLEASLAAIPDDLPNDGDEFRKLSRGFYSELRETWERAVEEVVLGGVVERFGSDVRTQSLKSVEVTDDDYRIIFFAMKRASERSGHDQAAGRQIDTPDKAQMRNDLQELRDFIAARRKEKSDLESRRRALESAPKATLA